ncbi:hypothetical protein [Desulfotalea psychrophila]|uniref:hypothetical protein n=1 Tax=Desulfotalea psychrophila TaxID=84980 RepID=UPI0012EA479E|nr:hypothetical protein [Desulfotalea psychrophila]
MKTLLHAILIFTLILLASCSSKAPTMTEEQKQEAAQSVASIAVLSTTVYLSDVSPEKKKELTAGAVFVDTRIQEELTGNAKVQFVGDRQQYKEFPEVDGGLKETALSIGKSFGCDAVLVPTLERFVERVGSNMSVTSPASARFSLVLLDTQTGQTIWTRQFKETQQSFMSNILAFGKMQERGLKWITVEQMVGQAIKEQLADCPYL